MVDGWILGLTCGAGAMVLKALVLWPLVRRRAAPWTHGAAQILETPIHIRLAGGAGWFLMACYGAFWGVVFAAVDSAYPPVLDSYVLQGMVFGALVFSATALGVRVWPSMHRIVDRRLWIGLLLTDLLFGATLGLMFLLWGPFSPLV